MKSNPDASERLATQPVGRLLASTAAQTTVSVGTYGLYALTNAWFVSRGVGPDALAAVNVAAPILLLIGAVATTVGAGGASVLSRALGAGDRARAARATGTAMGVYYLTAVLFGGLGIALLDPLVRLLGATDDIAGLAHDYSLILLLGAVTATGFSSLVRAEGRITYSMMMWVIPVCTQIALDAVFILGFGWGVRGAALGTVGGQAVSAVMALWYFFGRRARPYRLRATDLVPDLRLAREIALIGAPSFLAGLGATLFTAITNNLLAAAGGAIALAAFAVASRIGTFVLMPQLGITQAMQPIVGFNHGRGLTERAHRTRSLSLAASLTYGVAMAVVFFAIAPAVTSVFTDDPATRDLGTTALRIIALSYPFAGVVGLAAAWFQSLGRAWPSLALSLGTLLGVRLPALLIMATFGLDGLWWSYPVGEAVAAGVAWLVLRRAVDVSRPAAP